MINNNQQNSKILFPLNFDGILTHYYYLKKKKEEKTQNNYDMNIKIDLLIIAQRIRHAYIIYNSLPFILRYLLCT